MNYRLIYAQITKYVLLLALFNFLSFAFTRGWNEFRTNYSQPMENLVVFIIVPFAFNALLNLVMVFVINNDIRKHQVNTRYVSMATILYRPVGVLAYLLFLFLQERNAGLEEKNISQ